IYCPNCGWSVSDPSKPELQKANRQLQAKVNPDRGGDKILVFKFPYLHRDPDRWDVVVFYNPANPEENFIKRLIGRPGEAVQILDGDIYVGRADDPAGKMEIQRKPPQVQQTLWRGVYLNDFFPDRRDDEKTFPHWQPAEAKTGWVPRKRQFDYNPPAAAPADDRLVFEPDWLRLGFVDYYSYNGYPSSGAVGFLNVVWDLRVEFVVTFKQAGGSVSASMNHHSTDHSPAAGDTRPRFVATFHQDGKVELRQFVDGSKTQVGQTETFKLPAFPLNVGVPVALQDVDYQASAWVDGKQRVTKNWTPDLYSLRQEEPRRTYVPKSERPEREPSETPTVCIQADGAHPLELRHVNLYRDVYYTTRTGGTRSGWINRGSPSSAEQIVKLKKWNPDGEDPNDEFFVMGDNSPSSSDGRLWKYDGALNNTYWHLVESGRLKLDEHNDRLPDSVYEYGRVPRDHLIGRAFFVYWPAALPLAGSGLPAVPNVGRMRLIH
ncbi:MAG: S26 family signal peptidase, partial [Phycisphaerae bacterium]|nr:S26 family signal peptidase [Phycisphaerae bacterium]